MSSSINAFSNAFLADFIPTSRNPAVPEMHPIRAVSQSPQPQFSSAESADYVDQEYNFLDENEINEIIGAVNSSNVPVVAIAELRQYSPVQQQYFIVHALLGKLYEAFSKVDLNFGDTSNLVKMGAVIVKLSKTMNSRDISGLGSSRPDLSTYSVAALLGNLGVTVIKRRPREDIFTLMSHAFNANTVQACDPALGVVKFSVGGSPMRVRFYNRLCCEIAYDDKDVWTFTDERVTKFNMLITSLRNNMDWKGFEYKLTKASTSLINSKVDISVRYSNSFLAWYNANARRVNGEALWYLANDLSADANVSVIPAPYTVTIGNRSQEGSYFDAANIISTLFEREVCVVKAEILGFFRALRSGTYLDTRYAKECLRPAIVYSNNKYSFFESVIAKLGAAYSLVSAHEGPVHMFGVTDKENLMVKAVIESYKFDHEQIRLYDIQKRLQLDYGARSYPVTTYDIKGSGDRYEDIESLGHSLVIIDVLAGSNDESNNVNVRFAEHCLKNGAIGCVVKLFAFSSSKNLPCLAHYAAKLLEHGRYHNGEFFVYMVPHAVGEYNILGLYDTDPKAPGIAPLPTGTMNKRFLMSNLLRGVDGFTMDEGRVCQLFAGVSNDTYPMVRRATKNFEVKNWAKYSVAITTTKDTTNLPKFDEEVAGLFSGLKISEATHVKSSVETIPRPSQPNALIAAVKNSGVPAVVGVERSLPFSTTAAPKKAPATRFVCRDSSEEYEYMGMERHGMPVYVWKKHSLNIGGTALISCNAPAESFYLNPMLAVWELDKSGEVFKVGVTNSVMGALNASFTSWVRNAKKVDGIKYVLTDKGIRYEVLENFTVGKAIF